jgi:DNA-binding NtrC family response regulator
MSKPKILVVDDEQELLTSIQRILSREKMEVITATCAEEALLALQQSLAPDLVISDLMMPGIGGLELLKMMRTKMPEVPVILITAHATLETAIEAIRAGAYDYLPKPFGPDQLTITVQRALNHRKLKNENQRLRAQVGSISKDKTESLIGESEPMRRVKDLLRRVGPTDLSVLVTGESGTGKEVFAQALHNCSKRHRKAFVPVDCAAIPATLMESELFGHEKGAFTGASSRRKGLVETANGGTFFLDEIGELAMPVQVKLLRLLQEREFRRVGGTEIHKVDLRVVAATNRNLEEAVEKGEFREDLYHRLNVVQVVLPPLRERGEDVPLLLQGFLDRLAAQQGRNPLHCSPEVAGLLSHYSWPGNVRELFNCARYLSGLTAADVAQMEDLPLRIRQAAEAENPRGPSPPMGSPSLTAQNPSGSTPAVRYDLSYKKAKRLWLEVFEYAYINRLLEQHDGNISHAARAAGIDRKSIQRLMKRNEMSLPRQRQEEDTPQSQE